MAFYFFTDIDLQIAQTTSDQAFGPAGTDSGFDKFQVTSLHTATANPNAYAVCDGIVFAIENTDDTTLINLILKPTQQPPFAFPKIKFIIYRGILKTSLLDANGTDIAPSANNDLTKSLWDSQTAINNSAGTTDNPPMQALGYDLVPGTFATTISIDNIFYRSDVNFQLPIVNAGWNIGQFASAGFGFEIMLESIGFDPTLDLVKGNSNDVKVTTLTGSPDQPTFFEHWHNKEQILNYVDPCAFFGSFYNSKLLVYTSGSGTDTWSGDDIYGYVLNKAFYNKNTVYLDIRNEYNFSLNYFKNYGTSPTVVETDIQLACDADGTTSLSSTDYYAGNWPLLILAKTNFATGNTSAKNVIQIQLPDGGGDNGWPTIYLSAANLNDDYPRETTGVNKLIDVNVTSDFTDTVAIAVPNDGTFDGTTTPVSCYVKLKYLKRLPTDGSTPAVSSGTVIRAQNYLDNLFAPFDMKIPFGGTDTVKSVVYDEDMYVDRNQDLSSDYICNIGLANDPSTNTPAYVTVFAFPSIVRNQDETVKQFFALTGEIDDSGSTFIDSVIKAYPPGSIRNSEFIISGVHIGYREFINDDSSFTTPDYNQFISVLTDLAIFSSTSDYILTELDTNYRVYLGITNIQNLFDDIGINYISYELVLRGFSINGGTGNLEFKEIHTDPSASFTTNLIIYSNGNS